MGHPSDMVLGNALGNGAYPELNRTSKDLVAAADYYYYFPVNTVERGTKVNEDRDQFLVLVYIAHLKYMSHSDHVLCCRVQWSKPVLIIS